MCRIFKNGISLKILLIFLPGLLIIRYSLHAYLCCNTDSLEISSKIILIAFSPKNEIAIASRHRVEIFDIKTRKRLSTFEVNTDITAIQFSPDGAYLAIARDAMVNFLAVDQGKEIPQLRLVLSFPKSLSFSPDGEILAIGYIGRHGDASIYLVTVERAEPALRPLCGYSFALFSHDGNWLATIPDWSRSRPKGCGIEILKVEKIQGKYNIKCEKTLAPHLNLFDETQGNTMRSRQVTSIALTPDAKILASIQKDDDHLIRLWSLEICQELRNVRGDDEITAIAFSPDGKLLAAAGEDGKITLWSVETGCRLTTKWTHSGKANCVAFSPDGKFLASGGNDCQVKFWKIPNLAEK